VSLFDWLKNFPINYPIGDENEARYLGLHFHWSIHKMSLTINDPAIAEAYTELKADNSETNWIVTHYDSTGKALEFAAKGTKGLEEMTEQFHDDIIVYGVFKMFGIDEDSKRTKFVTVVWVGPNCKPMVRAKVSTHKSVVLAYFKGAHLELHYGSKSDISKDDIVKRLNANTGSHKPKAYDFGEGNGELYENK
jgi:hypothetical protein